MSLDPVLILIDTSTRIGQVAVSRGQQLAVQVDLDPRRGHARDLVRTIRTALMEANSSINEVSAIGLNLGPGSFTGIRVALATVKALAYSTRIKLLSTNVFQLVAERFRDSKRNFRIIVEFQLNAWLVADCIDGSLRAVRRIDASSIGQLLTDEMPLAGPGLEKLMRSHPRALSLGEVEWRPRAEDFLAQILIRHSTGHFDNALTIEPYYATVCSAEQIWDARRTSASE